MQGLPTIVPPTMVPAVHLLLALLVARHAQLWCFGGGGSAAEPPVVIFGGIDEPQSNLSSQQPPDVGFQSLFLGHCAANVAGPAGRSKPERMCAFCVCAFCACWYLRRLSC